MPEIVVLAPKNFHLSEKLESYYTDRLIVEDDWRPSVIELHNPDLVLTFEESSPERGLCIAEMSRKGVATLLMMDGIPEWRNTWSRRAKDHKRPINQPILSHKVACLGQTDARIYESWGNIGKCEVVGSPRFDVLIELDMKFRTEPIVNRPLRLLVMTAKTPGFTPDEVEKTFQSLQDLRDQLDGQNNIQVTWRLTQGLNKRLRVKNTLQEATGKELNEVLNLVDAVITTPSTAMLEAMLFGHPVALLDYHNCPHYIPAAWRIGCKDHINLVLEDLRDAPLDRMIYQDYCLHDALACRTAAMPRAVELIEEMIKIKRKADVEGSRELIFPHRILDTPEEFVAWPAKAFDLQNLYPQHPVFGRSDLAVMQAELESALGAIDNLKYQADILTSRLHRIPGYLLAKRVAKEFQKRFA